MLGGVWIEVRVGWWGEGGGVLGAMLVKLNGFGEVRSGLTSDRGEGALLSKCMVSLLALTGAATAVAQRPAETISGWQMQDVAKVSEPGAVVSSASFKPVGWYRATVPGTVLTTLVDNKVYPEPLYGENMRAIPESLNKTSYWYRTSFLVPAGV